MKKIKALAIFNVLSLILNVSVSYLTRAKLINKTSIGEVAAKYDNLFAPAPLSFGIWGIIYTTLAVLCLYHVVMAYKHEKWNPANTELERMNVLLMITNLAGAAWLVAWMREELVLSVFLIFIQVICLVAIHLRLHIYDRTKPAGLKVCSQFALSIYLGWISIAAIANVAACLVAIGWDGFGLAASEWTIIMISFAVAISLLVIFARHNIYFGLMVGWGLYGITLKRGILNEDQNITIIVTAWMGIGVILLSCIAQWLTNLGYKKPPEIFQSTAGPIK